MHFRHEKSDVISAFAKRKYIVHRIIVKNTEKEKNFVEKNSQSKINYPQIITTSIVSEIRVFPLQK